MKSMKTIFGVLAAASLLFSVNAFAQENGNRDENGNVVRGPYETNAFGDNWFVGGGIGLNAGFNTGNVAPAAGKVSYFTAPGIGLDVYGGKWLTPEYGLRLAYHGLTNGSSFSPLDLYKHVQHFMGLDVLFDLSTLIDGYVETRNWSWIAYPSAGLSIVDVPGDGVRANPGWALGAGLIAKKYAFLGNENLDMIIEGRVLAVADKDGYNWNTANKGFPAQISFPLSLSWGVAYKLGKQGFQRHSSVVPAIIPVPFTTEQYEDLSGKVAELEKENAELKDKIAALENEVAPLRQLVNGQTYLYDNGTFTAVDAAAGAPVTLYFDCGSATLSAREKAHFEYFTKNVVNENTKLSVNGYADKQTGSAKRNQQLSEQRVKTVVDLLKKAGAAEENIESAAHGATVQPFDSAAKNRVVTIEVK